MMESVDNCEEGSSRILVLLQFKIRKKNHGSSYWLRKEVNA